MRSRFGWLVGIGVRFRFVHPLVKGTPGIPGGRLNGSIDLGRGFIGRQCEFMDVVTCPCVFVCMIACVCGLLCALGCVQPPPTH